MSRDSEISKAVDVLREFDGIAAIGLSGSSARGNHDEMSDLDIAVFASDQIPDPATRKHCYTAGGVSRAIYFDVDFEVSRGDGLSVDGVECSFIWMELPRTKRFVKALATDYDCDEFLPGGLMTIKPLFDPEDTIASLRASIPAYSEERAKHRITKSLTHAYASIYILAWMSKAAARNDWFSFLRYEYAVFDNFFTALFALNRQWYSDEKRLAQLAGSFEMSPKNVTGRVESIVMRKDICASLTGTLQEIKRLFGDLAALSKKVYPALDVPSDWR